MCPVNSLSLLIAHMFVSSRLETHKFPVLLLAAQETAALWCVREDEWQEVASIYLQQRS